MRTLVIGNGTLAALCVECLIEEGYSIVAIVTQDVSVQNLFSEKKIVICKELTDCSISFRNLDYIFSINNDVIIPEKILSKSKKLSINYHNSLLPRYAGINACAHAINNEEAVHGVSWHIMEGKIDSGAVLIQEQFAIEPDDTTEILNIKCFQAALETFKKIIKNMAAITAVPQNIVQRTYYAYRDNFYSEEVALTWDSKAEKIAAFIRSCQFGAEANYFGLPIIKVGSDLIVIKRAAVVPTMRSFRSGLLKQEKGLVFISTGDYYLLIGEVTDLYNQPLDLANRIDSQKLYLKEKRVNFVAKLDIEAEKKIEYSLFSEEALLYKRSSIVVKKRVIDVNLNSMDIILMLAISIKYVVEKKLKDEFVVWFDATLLVECQKNNANQLKYCFFKIRASEFTNDMSFRRIKNFIERKIKNAIYLDSMFFVRHKRFNTDIFCQGRVNFVVDSIGFLQLSDKELAFFYYSELESFDDAEVKKYYNDNLYEWESLRTIQRRPNREAKFINYLCNKNQVSFKTPKNLAAWFDSICRQYPDKLALVSGEQKLTFSELKRQSSAMASFLIKQGIKPGEPAIIGSSNVVRVIISIFAILKAGAFYIPVDLENPMSRILFVVDVSDANYFITEKYFFHSSSDLLKNKIKFVDISLNYPVDDECVYPKIEEISTLYSIFTSGTTGSPKGVMVTHHNVMRLFKATEKFYKFSQDDNWVLFHSYCFDFSVWEIFGALLYGGTLYILDRQSKLNPKLLFDFITKNEITILNQTPSYFYQILDDLYAATRKLNHSLRCIIFGGEKLNFKRLRPFINKHSKDFPVKFINMYGITEATVHAALYALKPEDLESDQSIIGALLADFQGVVLDYNKHLTPIGDWGELYLSGPGIAKGYLNDQSLTSVQFIELKHLGLLGTYYKTGDVVRLNQNGDLEYKSRNDSIRKIRGYRINLDEIKAVLESFDSVERAEVLMSDEAGQPILLAYYTSMMEKNADFLKKKLMEYVCEKMPTFMLPSSMMHVSEFPLTENGKVDKSVLLKEYYQRQNEIDEETSTDHLEYLSKFVEICRTLLRCPTVNQESDFFLAGGNSLLAMRLSDWCNKAFLWNLDVAEIYRYRKLVDIYRYATTFNVHSKSYSPMKFLYKEKNSCSPIQKAIWFASHSLHVDYAYNVGFCFLFPRFFPVKDVRTLFSELISKLGLSAAFHFEGGELSLIKLEKVNIPMVALKKEELKPFIENDFAKPLDLSESVLQLKILHLQSKSRCMAYFKSHHAYTDGESILIILQMIKSYLKKNREKPGKFNVPVLDREIVERSSCLPIYQRGVYCNCSDVDIVNNIVQHATESSALVSISSGAVSNEFGVFLIKTSLAQRISRFINDEKISYTAFFVAIYMKSLFHIYQKSPLIGLTLNSRAPSDVDRLGSYATLMPFFIPINEETPARKFVWKVNNLINQLLQARRVAPQTISNIIRKHFQCALSNLFGFVITYNDSMSRFQNNGFSNHFALLKPKIAKYQHHLEISHYRDIFKVECWNGLRENITFADFKLLFIDIVHEILDQDSFRVVGHKKSNRTGFSEVAPNSSSSLSSLPRKSQLYTFFCHFLKVESFDKNAGFFELGITSLSIFDLAREINTHFNIDITPADLFRCANFSAFEVWAVNIMCEQYEKY